MIRLFVAIRPPRAMRAALLGLHHGIAGARWQDDDRLHLTLRFIGAVDARTADDIAGALAQLRSPRFDLALAGTGSFARKGHADAVWAGIAPHDRVTALHRKLDAALLRIGLAPEGRAYLPHVTVARLGHSAGPVGPWLAAHAALAGPPHEIASFCLYESVLGSQGARYTIAERYPLG